MVDLEDRFMLPSYYFLIEPDLHLYIPILAYTDIQKLLSKKAFEITRESGIHTITFFVEQSVVFDKFFRLVQCVLSAGLKVECRFDLSGRVIFKEMKARQIESAKHYGLLS